MYANISPRNDLSSFSLAAGTRLGRRRFDTGSNSSSDLPNDSLTDHRATLSVVTLPETHPELCHFTGRLATLSSNSTNRDSPSNSPKALKLGSSTSEATLPATACQAALSLSNSTNQILSQQLLSQSFVTVWFDIGNSSSSVYLQSDSLTEQITCRVTLPPVILPKIRLSMNITKKARVSSVRRSQRVF
jgi:hypothetical protein